MPIASDVIRELRKYSSPSKATSSAWFFKTGKGEYGEHDQFIGVTVPEQRRVARMYRDLPLAEMIMLLHSPYHEHRLTALFIMVLQFRRGTTAIKKQIYGAYIKNSRWVNNWDLVDSSAPYIVGEWLYDKKKSILYTYARSKNLWQRRISILSAGGFIKHGNTNDVLKLSKLLLTDNHDLIHKAVGWMLRVVGDYDRAAEERFLQQHIHQMPRTMLRYAIEKFPEVKRKKYLVR